MKVIHSFFLLLALLASSVTHAAFTQIISVGDSLSDIGNNGRFTNPGGLIWTEMLAGSLGIPVPTASNSGGTGGAFGGARTTVAAFGVVPSAQTQANLLTANYTAIDPNALYTIMIGGNDVNASANAIEAAYTQAYTDELTASGDTAAAEAAGDNAASVEGAIQAGILQAEGAAAAQIAVDLVANGAQNVLFSNVPNVALAPIADGNEGLVQFLTNAFNGGISSVSGLVSSNIAVLDAFGLLNDIAADPGSFGLTNITDKCEDEAAGSGCENTFLFWDDLHPTTIGHQIIADAALVAANTLPAAIPVPAAFPLLLSALAGLGWLKRKSN